MKFDKIDKNEIDNKKTNFWDSISFTLIVLAIILPIRFFIAKPFIVDGLSMFPTFNSWHYLIVDQISYRFENPSRGDVIVFRYPLDPSRFFIKRVIGLPGETVILKDGKTIIKNKEYPDGFTLKEPFVSPDRKSYNSLKTVLNKDEYFVMGDNRINSSDSRRWGPVPRKFIVGRAFVRLFPFTKIDLFPGENNYKQ